MNLAKLQSKLVAAARAQAPDDRVPYAFETRVMARLRAPAKTDELAWWGRALGFGACACAAATLAIGAWTYSPDSEGGNDTDGFSHGVEQSLFAVADDSENSW